MGRATGNLVAAPAQTRVAAINLRGSARLTSVFGQTKLVPVLVRSQHVTVRPGINDASVVASSRIGVGRQTVSRRERASRHRRGVGQHPFAISIRLKPSQHVG